MIVNYERSYAGAGPGLGGAYGSGQAASANFESKDGKIVHSDAIGNDACN